MIPIGAAAVFDVGHQTLLYKPAGLPAQSEERRVVLDSPRTQAAALCRDSLESRGAM